MKKAFLIMALSGISVFAFSQKPASPAPAAGFKMPASFTENKGQIADNEGKRRDDILFTTTSGGATLFLRTTGISYVFYKERAEQAVKNNETALPDASPSITGAYRMDWELVGSNTTAEVSGEEEGTDTLNFYYPTCPDGVTGVKNYNRIRYKNVYEGIDLVFYRKDGNLKYDFIVRPGGNPNNIRIRMTASDKVEQQRDGSLTASCPLGTISEDAPYCFMQDGSSEINSSFVVKGNEISFSVKDYDKTKTLVIDPATRVWGTYYGGSAEDHINDIAYYDGSPLQMSYYYVTGYTGSTTFIASPGAYDVALYGGKDAFIAKFDINGVRMWGTYYGGDNDDYATSIAYNSSAIGICGYTTSWYGMTTAGCFQPTSTGEYLTLIEYDGFIAKFTTSGVRSWSTFYGSLGADYCFAITGYTSGSFLIGGRTQGNDISNPHPFASPGAIQPNTNNILDDGFLARFNSTGTRNWGTYFGGNNGYTAINDIAVEPSTQYIIIVGETTVPSSFALSGYDNSYGGNKDGFMARIYNTGTSLLNCSYYGGTAVDMIQSVAIDPATNNIYLGGYTASSSSIASAGAFQTVYGGIGDEFLLKMTPGLGARLWSTYYGGYTTENSPRVCVDVKGNVFLAGTTESPSAISTPNSWQPVFGGYSDLFFAKFNSNGSRLWASYLGSTPLDAASAIHVNSSGMLAIAGYTASPNAGYVMATASAHQLNFNGVHDGVINQFRDNDIVVTSVPSTSLCQGETFTLSYTVDYLENSGNIFVAQLSNSAGSFASPVNIGQVTATGSGTIACTVPLSTVAGTGYRIRVTASNLAITGIEYAGNITVKANPATPVIYLTTPLCTGQPENFSTNWVLGATYSWTGQNGFSSNLQSPTLSTTSLLTQGNYSLDITVNGCTSPSATVFLDMVSSPAYQSIQASGPAKFCEGGSLTLSINLLAGFTCQWYKNGVLIPGETNASYVATVTGIYTVIVTDAVYSCGTAMNNVNVTTYPCRLQDDNSAETQSAEMEVFPNPGNGAFTLSAGNLSGPVKVSVTDISGRIILSKMIEPVNGIILENLNVENAMSGIYFVTLQDGDKLQVKKLTVVR